MLCGTTEKYCEERTCVKPSCRRKMLRFHMHTVSKPVFWLWLSWFHFKSRSLHRISTPLSSIVIWNWHYRGFPWHVKTGQWLAKRAHSFVILHPSLSLPSTIRSKCFVALEDIICITLRSHTLFFARFFINNTVRVLACAENDEPGMITAAFKTRFMHLTHCCVLQISWWC